MSNTHSGEPQFSEFAYLISFLVTFDKESKSVESLMPESRLLNKNVKHRAPYVLLVIGLVLVILPTQSFKLSDILLMYNLISFFVTFDKERPKCGISDAREQTSEQKCQVHQTYIFKIFCPL